NPPPQPPVTDSFDINTITDTYAHVASIDNVYKWGPYNVHDPSIIKSDGTYYCYSTDAAYGTAVKPGIQVRLSEDLIEWQFVGWVFDDIPAQGKSFIQTEGGTPNQGLWAPCVIQVGSEYRLYYSLASNLPRLSCIGLATASNPLGPWTEKGIVVTSYNNSDVHTNAIDPTILIDQSGRHWMYYGSSWDAIYLMELNSGTGLAKSSGDKGVRIAHRGFSGNTINGNIEGPEIIYNPDFGMYYLFIAYDWLETKYNVRVGRSTDPQGPFLDYEGNDMNQLSDNVPMILAPYKFDGHSGWQGVSHPTVFDDGAGQFYIAHQGRPGVDHYYMVLHNRKIHWTSDGWPITSPERYAGVAQAAVTEADLVGNYEQIILGYQVVPGFADTQISPNFQTAIPLEIGADGTMNNDPGNTWTYNAPWLTLTWGNGYTDILYVERGRDWENSVASTILLSGLNNDGTAIWAKKVN
ncbi:MAG: arabinan endo-1,5-alpha-L-arabinosidase, partial [Phaeodactylibacter sp.]|nr:arabinan endo-1,5-alpha-L-arabinosidase [Phaeodactylibacter sp.]